MYEYIKDNQIHSITTLMAERNMWGDVAAIFGAMSQEEREEMGVYPIVVQDPTPFTKNLSFVKEFDAVAKTVVHKYNADDMTPAEAKTILKKKLTAAQLKALDPYKDDIELANLLGEELDVEIANAVDGIKADFTALRAELDAINNIADIRTFATENNL